MQRRPTGRHFHRYFNPGREMEAGAQEVTGLDMNVRRTALDSGLEDLEHVFWFLG